jgi:hypothetical protein
MALSTLIRRRAAIRARGGPLTGVDNAGRQAGTAPRTVGIILAGIKRWVVRRKAAVVMAVLSGLITLEEACRRYQLSEEEFLAWKRPRKRSS